jgi:biopolymer transport protein ExbB
MFEGKTLWQVFNMGGFTMYILLLCSVVSIAVILNRLINYYFKSVDRNKFMARVRSEIEKKDFDRAMKICQSSAAPVSAVVLAGIRKNGHDEKTIISAMDREIMQETVKLEKNTAIVGTIGNIAVYIGLFGTVLGIVRSFHNISSLGSGHINVVIGGVAEALICTATGLSVAIPAVIAYNYFLKRIDNFVIDMEYCASEVTELLTSEKPK